MSAAPEALAKRGLVRAVDNVPRGKSLRDPFRDFYRMFGPDLEARFFSPAEDAGDGPDPAAAEPR